MKSIKLVISCEHAVNAVPEPYQSLFAPYQELLQSHRGIDFGALTIATTLSKKFECTFVQAKATRLLIDCNRSLSHHQCFSEITSLLSQEEKCQLIENYYLPFRQEVEKNIKKHIQQGSQVLHLSIHSFTPNLNGLQRNSDLGFLYDPKRPSEKNLARRWQLALRGANDNAFRIRLNYPYLGISNGFTAFLRKKYLDQDYAGIEVEANQSLVLDEKLFYHLSNLLTLTLGIIIA